jgi:hypothetical protein
VTQFQVSQKIYLIVYHQLYLNHCRTYQVQDICTLHYLYYLNWRKVYHPHGLI